MNLCACGCGTPVFGTWQRGHISRVRNPNARKPWDEIPKMVDTETGCLRWGGTHHSQGYGLWGSEYAHRVAWERENGPLPEDLELDHVAARGCRWRDCILVAHLEPVTHIENMHRSLKIREQLAKTHCPQGHAYTPENTLRRPSAPNKRDCRRCTYDRNAARKRAKKESA